MLLAPAHAARAASLRGRNTKERTSSRPQAEETSLSSTSRPATNNGPSCIRWHDQPADNAPLAASSRVHRARRWQRGVGRQNEGRAAAARLLCLLRLLHGDLLPAPLLLVDAHAHPHARIPVGVLAPHAGALAPRAGPAAAAVARVALRLGLPCENRMRRASIDISTQRSTQQPKAAVAELPRAPP